MAFSGFKFNIKKLRSKLAAIKGEVQASAFRPELEDFTRRSLTLAAKDTPVRNLNKIRAAQRRQYQERIDCIPSAHQLLEPSLRVRGENHWLFTGGKWYLANRWQLSPEHYSAYASLMMERERRMQTIQDDFITERARSRWLYRRSWVQVGSSLGLNVRANGVNDAATRRKPPVEPPRGYGQWRGGKQKLTVVIFNPFLKQPSRYRPFEGEDIIYGAMQKEAPRYQERVGRKIDRIVRKRFKYLQK